MPFRALSNGRHDGEFICKVYAKNNKKTTKNGRDKGDMSGKRLYLAIGYLPDAMAREIDGILRGSRLEIREIRLRAVGACSVVTDRGSFPLSSRIELGGLEKIVERLCRGSIYAFRECINAGYIPLSLGVRVGIVGEARYDGERLVGVSGISALSFRIPTAACSFDEELYRSWLSLKGENLLILAPPSGGKTTALRALARFIGTGRGSRRVVVVDERCEFDPEDYRGCTVDILQGYRRGLGTEVAVRTMSPEVLLVDEIASAGDAAALRTAVGVGIPVVATAHGTDPASLLAREYLASLLRDGCFSRFCGIENRGGSFYVTPPSEIAV